MTIIGWGDALAWFGPGVTILFLEGSYAGNPAPIREVCFCSAKGRGWRWEVHLDTREVYGIDGNRDLEQRYGITHSQ